MINLSPLLKLFNQIPGYNTLADAIHDNETISDLRHPLGVFSAARPGLLAALRVDLQRPIFFITARADRAKILKEQIQIWADDPHMVYRLPDPDALPHEKLAWGHETIQGRLAALGALVGYANNETPPPLIVTSARALMHKTLPPKEFTMVHYKIGQRINLNEVVGQWVELGYQPEEVVEIPGSFSRRGGILDVFPPNSNVPVRIELFGDEIDSLRSFDPVTQRSEARLKQFTVSPANEALPRHAHHAAEQLAQWDLTNLQPGVKIALEEDIARLDSGTTFRSIEYYLPFFYNGISAQTNGDPGASVLDYLPDDALVFIEDPDELAGVVDEIESQARTLKKDLSDVGDLPADWPDPYFGWKTLPDALSAQQPMTLGFTQLRATNQANHQTDPDQPRYLLQSTFSPPPSFGGQVKNVLEEVVKRKKSGERVVLVSRQAQRLSSLLDEHAQLMVNPVDSLAPGNPPPPSGSISIIQGMLMEGWAVTGEDGQSLITVMSDSELFGWKKPTTIRRPKPRKGVTPETFFADVNPGDLVVHIEHGIGRYVGLVKLDFEGVEREYLAVEYANNDKLYVPIHQADRLARYMWAWTNTCPFAEPAGQRRLEHR